MFSISRYNCLQQIKFTKKIGRKTDDIPYQSSAVKLANLKKQILVNQVALDHRIVQIYNCKYERGKRKYIQQKFKKVTSNYIN